MLTGRALATGAGGARRLGILRVGARAGAGTGSTHVWRTDQYVVQVPMEDVGQLTARAAGTVDGVLGLSFLAVAVHGRLLSARALGFSSADATSFTTAA